MNIQTFCLRYSKARGEIPRMNIIAASFSFVFIFVVLRGKVIRELWAYGLVYSANLTNLD